MGSSRPRRQLDGCSRRSGSCCGKSAKAASPVCIERANRFILGWPRLVYLAAGTLLASASL